MSQRLREDLFLVGLTALLSVVLTIAWSPLTSSDPPTMDGPTLYCMAIGDTGANAGVLKNVRTYSDFVDRCVTEILTKHTFWDYHLQPGIEYLLSVYQAPPGGGGGIPVLR